LKTVISFANLTEESQSKLRLVSEFYLTSKLSPRELEDVLPRTQVVIAFEIPEALLGKMTSLELIQSVSAGVDSLPWQRIPQNVTVCSNAGSNAIEVNEHAWSLILAAAKNLVQHTSNLKRLKFERSPESLILSGKTLLVFGLGHVGREIAVTGKAFGMKVMGINSSGKTDVMIDECYTASELSQVLPRADVVVLSAQLNKSTRHMIMSSELSKMKESAILVNIARAELIQKQDLKQHLSSHPSFKFASDVWWNSGKEIGSDKDVLGFENVIGTPWKAGGLASPLVMNKMLSESAERVMAYLAGSKPTCVVSRLDYVT
jgi:phosphoglycerate dehydrogenase-like enzyme